MLNPSGLRSFGERLSNGDPLVDLVRLELLGDLVQLLQALIGRKAFRSRGRVHPAALQFQLVLDLARERVAHLVDLAPAIGALVGIANSCQFCLISRISERLVQVCEASAESVTDQDLQALAPCLGHCKHLRDGVSHRASEIGSKGYLQVVPIGQ